MKYFVFITSTFFVCTGVFVLWSGRDPLAGWSAIFFFGGCWLMALWEIWPRHVDRPADDDPADAPGQRRSLVVKNDVRFYLVFTAAALGFTFAGLLMVASSTHSTGGWLVAWLFGPCAFVFLLYALDRRPRLIIDRDGVIDRMLGVGRIDWADIKWAHLQAIEGNVFVCLVLRDPSKYLHKKSWLGRKWAHANRVVGFSELNINLSGVWVNPEEVLWLIIWNILEQQKRDEQCVDPSPPV